MRNFPAGANFAVANLPEREMRPGVPAPQSHITY